MRSRWTINVFCCQVKSYPQISPRIWEKFHEKMQSSSPNRAFSSRGLSRTPYISANKSHALQARSLTSSLDVIVGSSN